MKLSLALLASATVTSLPCFAAPAPLRESAIALHEKHADSVVFLSAVVELEITVSSAPTRKEERKLDLIGTVIGKDGLLVTPLSTIDVAANVDGRTVNGPQGPVKISAKGTTKEVKILLPGGDEIEAKVVAKDPDLDLAFIRPAKPEGAKSLVPVDIANHAPMELLGDVIVLGRLKKELNRQPAVMTSEIISVIKKPRTFGKVGKPTLGLPVFNQEGKFLGIGINRFSAKSGGQQGSPSASSVVLPAEDLIDSASQAK